MTKEEFIEFEKKHGLEIPPNVEAVPCVCGWGTPEKFNTEAQYKNRLDELRRKMNHFEV